MKGTHNLVVAACLLSPAFAAAEGPALSAVQGVALSQLRGMAASIAAEAPAVAVAAPAPAALKTKDAAPVVYWEDVTADYAGKYITVEGVLQAVTVNEKVAYLNFHRNWTRYVTCGIFKTAFARFPADLKAAYEGKKVRITGKVRLYKGRPEIMLFSASQVMVLLGDPDKTYRLPIDKNRIGLDDGDSFHYDFSAAEGPEGHAFSGGLRLLGYDAPEIMHPEDGIFYDQEHGRDAARLAKKAFAEAKKITFITHGELDKYGRMLGYLEIDGELLGVRQIEAGLAYEFVTAFGDNGFKDEAAGILKAWSTSPIKAALDAGQKPPFMKPGDWRKLNQVHELAMSREQWESMAPAAKKELLAKVKKIVDERSQSQHPKP